MCKFMQSKWQRQLLKLLFTVGGLLLMSAGSARADFRVGITLSNVTMEGSNFRYTYTAFLESASELDAAGGGLNPGNWVVMYAIPGFISGSEVLSPAAFAAVFSASEHPAFTASIVPPTQVDHSVAGLTNLQLTYTGAAEINVAPGSPELTLGTFSFLSTNAPASSADLFYSAATQTNAPGQPNDEDIANNTATVLGPGPSAVPEPASLLLLFSGVPALLFVARRRKQAASRQ